MLHSPTSESMVCHLWYYLCQEAALYKILNTSLQLASSTVLNSILIYGVNLTHYTHTYM